MTTSKDLHSKDYYNRLRTYRDEALLHSAGNAGRVSLLGIVSFGVGVAEWQSEQGGAVWLRDQGLRIGKWTCSLVRPTTLTIVERGEEDPTTHTLTTYYMELDNDGLVGAYDSTLNLQKDRLKTLSHLLGHKYGRNPDMYDPTDEQRARLEQELERGASGAYTENVYSLPDSLQLYPDLTN